MADIWLRLMNHHMDVERGNYKGNPEAELSTLEDLLDEPYGEGQWLNRRRKRIYEKRSCPRWLSGVRGSGPVPMDKKQEVGIRKVLAALTVEIDNFTPGQAREALGKILPEPHPIRSVVKSHKLKQVGIARKYGCKPTFVSQVLAGRAPMPDRLLILILAMLENSEIQSAIKTKRG